MENVRDPLVERHPGPHREDQEGDDEAPEVELATVAQRVRFIRGPSRATKTIEQEDLVARVHEGVNALADHGRAARDARGQELRQGDEHIAEQGGIDHLPR